MSRLLAALLFLGPIASAAPMFSAAKTVHYPKSATAAAEVKARLRGLVGEHATGTQLRALAGAPRGAEVSASVAEDGGVRFHVTHPALLEPLRVVVHEDHGKAAAHIEMFRLDRKPGDEHALPAGAGARIFARQVVAAQQLGLAKIDLEAAGGHYDHVDYVGHLVWPRFGFNGPMPAGVTSTRNAPKDVRGYLAQGKRAQRQWAKAFDESPGTVELTFNLAPKSQSMRDLDHYLSERGMTPDVTGLE